MEQRDSPNFYAAGGHLHTMLKLAVTDVTSMPEGEQRQWALRGIATLLMAAPEEVQAEMAIECPGLELAEPIPDTHLTVEEQAVVSCLTQVDLQTIDAALVAGAASNWRKVARVVGDAMVTLEGALSGLPLGTYVLRLQILAQRGELEVQGNAQLMRFSEARLPTTGSGAA